MSLTPSSSTPRHFTANTGLGLKLTPSNSPYARTPRSPNKSRGLYESGLSLKRIIGTTVSSPTGFDSLSSLRIFGYCAGAAVVITTLDHDLQYSQRFFRARPTAVPLIACNPTYTATSTSTNFPPSTPTNTANDSRNRSVVSLRDSVAGYSPSTPGASQFDWSDSPSSKTWTSRERIKAAVCLSISRDGRFLAVGETGYMPRVLIFDLQESSDCPLVILNEHTFGVRAVAFSPDQRYLASLGDSNDGFLYIWSITKTGAARLHSSNKCTSFIKGMVWMGSSLITVGTRHVKVWRPQDGSSSPSKQRFNLDGAPLPLPAPAAGIKTLAGRNCLLGALVESTFTCVASISDRMAVICSEKGDICLLDDTDGQRLVKIGHTGFSITCIAVDTDRELVCIGGRVGLTKTLSFEDLIQASQMPDVRTDQDPAVPNGDSLPSTLCAMAFVDGIKVTVDSQHSIVLQNLSSTTDKALPEADARPQSRSSYPLTAHRDPVLGVRLLQQPNEMQADFLTWSSTGEVHFWDLQGSSTGSLQVEVEQLPGDEESANQCQVIRASASAALLVTGDKYGVLRIIDGNTCKNVFSTKAHGSEILDIAIHEGENATLIASCGRDRTVQLFRKTAEDWILLQTMDEHTASVNGLLFCEGGEKLVSCSADRSIQIRQLSSREFNGQDVMAAVPIKVITLKSSPVSMALSSNGPATALVVSSLDRTVATYDLTSGRLISSFRATDGDGNDAVVMDALIMGKSSSPGGRPTILAGLSSTDKSVRLYDGTTGAFVDREWGHTASVTGVALLETSIQTTVISTGLDGTIMIWDLTPKSSIERDEIVDRTNGSRNQSPPKETTSTRPPLRRVLSKAELAEFVPRPSPASIPTGRTSPPRPLRRKTSKYSMSTQSPKLVLPPIPSIPSSYTTTNDVDRRGSPRTRSRTPPASPKSKVTRRPSLASLEIRGRTRSTGNLNEFGTLNMATEQVCRTLRAYRKKLGTAECIRDEVLKELDQELRLTAKALGEKTLKTKALSETVLAGLLDQYSDRLVSIFDEKLRLSLTPHAVLEAGPSINGKLGSSGVHGMKGRLE